MTDRRLYLRLYLSATGWDSRADVTIDALPTGPNGPAAHVGDTWWTIADLGSERLTVPEMKARAEAWAQTSWSTKTIGRWQHRRGVKYPDLFWVKVDASP